MTQEFYLKEYTKKELEEKIRLDASCNPGDRAAGSLFARASLYLTELQRRTSFKFGLWSLIISIPALVLSMIAVGLSFLAINDSNKWKAEQIKKLEQINQSIIKENKELLNRINKPIQMDKIQIDKIIKELKQ